MPIDAPTAARALVADRALRNRAAYDGTEGVRRFDMRDVQTATPTGGGAGYVVDRPWRFLPPRPKMDPNHYARYTETTVWPGWTRSAVSGLVGSLFRDPPAVANLPPGLDTDATLTGRSAIQFAEDVAVAIILTGEATIVADVTDGDGRPYLTLVPAANILGLDLELGSAGRTVGQMRIRTTRTDAPLKDQYARIDIPRIRIYHLDAETGAYRVDTFERVPKRGGGQPEWTMVGSGSVIVRGAEIDFVPIVHVTYRDGGQPPITPVVDANTIAYRTDAARDLIIATTAPTLAITNSTIKQRELESFALGTHTVLNFPGESADVRFVGNASGDMAGIERRAFDARQLALAQGVTTLAGDARRGVESAEALRIRRASSLTQATEIADAVDAAMTGALTMAAALTRSPRTPEFRVDRSTIRIDEALVDRLKSLAEADLLTRAEVRRGLIAAGVLPADTDPDADDGGEPQVPDVGTGEQQQPDEG